MSKLRQIFFMACVLIAGVTALACPTRARAATNTAEISCVIDNKDEVPDTLVATTFNYKLSYFYSFKAPSNGYFVYPAVRGSYTLRLEDGVTLKPSFDTDKLPILSFEPTTGSSDRFALASIDLVSGTEPYTYDNNGAASVTCSPFFWAQMTSATCQVVLHFRYVPDLQPKQIDYDIEVSGSKRIDYLGDGIENPDTNRNGSNDYRLYLSADTGNETQDNYKSKNIIFIVDVSGSMDSSLGGSTRLQVLKNSARQMLKALSADSNNTYTVVSFASYARVALSKGTADDAINVINGLYSQGATAYYDGLMSAANLLQDDVRDSVIVFLTDGCPTAVGSQVGGLGGYSNQESVSAGYAAMAAEGLSGCDSFYGVYIGTSAAAATWTQIVTQKVNVTDEKFSVNATNQQEFELVINQLTARLQRPQTHIEIEDMLTENVVYRVGSDKVVKTSADGSTAVLTRGTDYTVTYDSATRTVKAVVNEVVQENTSYTLSFDVATSVSAVKQWLASGSYPDTGDGDTDYLPTGNATSSGQPGFYSNESAAASVVWDGGRKSVNLNRPVIQISFDADSNAAIKAHVRLYNMELSSNMFLYELVDESGSSVSIAGNNLDGDIFFPDLGFDSEGEWDFTIKPLIPKSGETGWIEYMEYDEAEIKVHVKASVTGDASGAADQMKLDVTYEPEPMFYCEYSLRKTQQ